MSTVPQQRAALIDTLFPYGIPRLICPVLTHYTDDGSIDAERFHAHIAHMRPYVAAFLAPGSTGDGWEMSEGEATQLLDLLVEEAASQDFALMVGVLRTERGTVAAAIRAILDRYNSGSADPQELSDRRICGFTVTPPKGSVLTQDTILAELETIASTGAPIAIYQLPQITENEMSPETVASLIARFPNIYLMKDTSGADRVVLAKPELENLFLVRGAEGDYARWIKSNDGYYDGFLLSTANSFAAELGTMIAALKSGDLSRAAELSGRVSTVVGALFAEAGKLGFGNPFANANKAFDHHFAWGPRANAHPAPMTHSGKRLPDALIGIAGRLLADNGFDVGDGYMS